MASVDRLLTGLLPDTRYAVRVRSYNALGVPSDWSEALDFTTPSDINPPAAPTNLIINFTTPDLALSWTPPAEDNVGNALTDLSHYNITLTSSGNVSVTYSSTNPYFIYTFVRNKADFGSPQSVLVVSVEAVDVWGNKSTSLTGTATNSAPPTPTDAPIATAGFTLVSIFMPDTATDIQAYILEYSLDTVTWNSLATSVGNAYTQTATWNTTYYYRYKLEDVFGQVSAGWSPVGTTTTPAVITDNPNPPATPVGLSLTTGIDTTTLQPYITATWTANTESYLNYYEIRWGKSTDTTLANRIVSKDLTTAVFTGLSTDTDYVFEIRAASNALYFSAWSSQVNIVTGHNTTAPAAPTGVSIVSGILTLQLSWTPNSEFDIAGYEVYASQAINFTPDTTGYTNRVYQGIANSYVFNTTAAQTWYFRVRAYDIYGNYSAFAAQVTGTSQASYIRPTTPPAVPTGLAVTAGSQFTSAIQSDYVDVTWTANGESDLSGYKVAYKRDADANWATVDVPQPATTTRIYSMQPNTLYDFKILAYDKYLNQSAYSAVVQYTTPKDAVPPAAPTGLTATPGVRSVILQWTPNTEADFANYNVYIGTASGFTPSSTNLFSTPAQSSQITVNQYWNGSAWVNVVPGTTYYFVMTAEDTSGNVSPLSTQVSAAPAYITNSDIVANTITGDKIVTNSLIADKISTGTLTATITNSGTIQTGTTGSRLILNSAGITGYAIDGTTVNFQYSTSNGNVSIGGSVITGGSITGSSISVGTSPNWFNVDTNGNIWSGGAAFGSAPFSVSNAGALTAKNILLDTTGMTSTATVFNSTNFILTAGGNLTVHNIVADGGTIGGVSIGSSALSGGTINGTTFNIANGGSINFTGSGGITWSAGASGGITVSNSGFVRSTNYSSTAGWNLGASGLTINQGTISATGISIGGTRNYVTNSSFEGSTSFNNMPTSWSAWTTGTGGSTYSVNTSQAQYGTQSAQIQTSAAPSNVGLSQIVTFPATQPSGTNLTLSAYFNQTAGTGRTAQVSIYPVGGGAALATYSSAVLTLNVWTRVSLSYTTTAAYSALMVVVSLSSTQSDTFLVDGVQLEVGNIATSYTPAPSEIPSNYMSNAWISNLSADRITSGQINTATLVINGSGVIQSYNYSTNAGYQITSSGATFQNGAISIVGAGGSVTIDSTSLRAIYGGTTVFQANSSGIILGNAGASTTIQLKSSGLQTSNYTNSGGTGSGAITGWQLNNSGSAFFGGNVTVAGTIQASNFTGSNTIGTNAANNLISTNYVSGQTVTGLSLTLQSGGALAYPATYWYTVTAVVVGESILCPPVSLSTASGALSVQLSWTAVPGATLYKVYRNTTNSFTSGSLLVGTTNTTSYIDTGATTTTGYPPSTAAGWAIKGDGNAEFGSGYFRGDISSATGTIGGWTINSSSLSGSGTISGGTISGSTISGGSISIGSGFSVNSSGVLTATGANISGTVTATAGTIGGWTINSGSLSGSGVISGGTIQAASISSGTSGYDAVVINPTGPSALAEIDFNSAAWGTLGKLYIHTDTIQSNSYFQINGPNGSYIGFGGSGGISLNTGNGSVVMTTVNKASNADNATNASNATNANYATTSAYANGWQFWLGGTQTNWSLKGGVSNAGTGYNSIQARNQNDTGYIDFQAQNFTAASGYYGSGAKYFCIPHPIRKGYKLLYAAIESPQTDLIHRGRVTLKGGKAVVNLDNQNDLTPGTVAAISMNPQFFLYNETGDANPRGSFDKDTLTITCSEADATIGWLVIVERCDQAMHDSMHHTNAHLNCEYPEFPEHPSHATPST